MLAPFEVVGERVQAIPGRAGLSFERLLTLADADPYCPLQQTADYALRPEEATLPKELWRGRVVLLAITGIASGYGGRLRFEGRLRGAQTQRDDLAALPPRRNRNRCTAASWKALTCGCSAACADSSSAR